VLVAAWRVVSNLFRRRNMATGGRALIARLRMALKDAGVPLWLATPAQDLILDDDGTVRGMTVLRDGKVLRVRGRRGVLLASGGFEHNDKMRERYLPEGGRANVSAGAVENEGDGILAGERIGAEVDLMDDAWWMPSVRHPKGSVIPLVSERAIPRAVIVDGRASGSPTRPRRTSTSSTTSSPAGTCPPGSSWTPPPASAVPVRPEPARAGLPPVLLRGRHRTRPATLRELAERIDVPADALEETVRRFNGFARAGRTATSAAATAPTTATTATPRWPTPTSTRSPTVPSTRSASRSATSAPRAGWCATSTAACCVPTARRSRGSTPPATPPPR
jgi:3-oxosteroid 1-dehydrogenase